MTTDCRFDVSRDSKSLTIFMGSTMENIDLADKETKIFLTDLELTSNAFAVSLVMREGLTNAVRHGHRFDINKTIQYSIKLEENTLIMEIEDQGEGFDWKNRRNVQPGADEDHGRGLPIIKNYFTDYKYNEKGNRVVLTKKL